MSKFLGSGGYHSTRRDFDLTKERPKYYEGCKKYGDKCDNPLKLNRTILFSPVDRIKPIRVL